MNTLPMDIEVSPEEIDRYVELQTQALDFARHGEVDTLVAMLDAGLPVNLSVRKGIRF